MRGATRPMHKKPSIKVRRRSERAPRACLAAMATMTVRSLRSQLDQSLGAVKNISRTGILMETGQPPLVGDSVLLRLAIGDRIHEIRATTARVARRGNSHFYEVGLDWRLADREQLAFLDDALAFLEQPQA